MFGTRRRDRARARARCRSGSGSVSRYIVEQRRQEVRRQVGESGAGVEVHDVDHDLPGAKPGHLGCRHGPALRCPHLPLPLLGGQRIEVEGELVSRALDPLTKRGRDQEGPGRDVAIALRGRGVHRCLDQILPGRGRAARSRRCPGRARGPDASAAIPAQVGSVGSVPTSGWPTSIARSRSIRTAAVVPPASRSVASFIGRPPCEHAPGAAPRRSGHRWSGTGPALRSRSRTGPPRNGSIAAATTARRTGRRG